MQKESELLIGALRNAVAEKPVCLPADVDWNAFLGLAKRHNVAALAYDGLKKDPSAFAQIPQEVSGALSREFFRAVYRDTQFDQLQERLRLHLNQEKIPHIFLKGAVLKHDYPVPALRTMSDLDVLVYPDDFKKIARVSRSLEGKEQLGDGNHRNYTFSGGLTVEFHPNIVHQETPVGVQINPGWQYAAQRAPEGAAELTEEGFYLSLICHMASHFVQGGIGARFVLDIWVYRNLRKTRADWAALEPELERLGLLEFARKIEQLAEAWFGAGERTPLLEELGEYILTSGTHGTSERAMLNAVCLSPGGSRFSALMRKAFYSREEMEGRFPWLRGRAWLMPAAWCVRAFRAVTRHGSHIRAWSAGTGKFTDAEIAAQREKLSRFGIKSAQQ